MQRHDVARVSRVGVIRAQRALWPEPTELLLLTSLDSLYCFSLRKQCGAGRLHVQKLRKDMRSRARMMRYEHAFVLLCYV